jgi:hypothetical protein
MNSVIQALTEQIEELEKKIRTLKHARDILNDPELSLPEPQVEQSKAAPAPLPVPKAPTPPRGLPCSACGKGEMLPGIKRVPSGVYVNMMQCSDSACNNEVY